MSTPRVIDGNQLASRIRENAAAKVRALSADGHTVCLDAILVGDPDAGRIYARSQEKRCRKVGLEYRLHMLDDDISNADLQRFIRKLSDDSAVSGIMLNLPLPPHLDAPAAQYAIDPYKDVEGVNPANIGLLFYGTPIIAPCTALAVMEILQEANVEVKGRHAVVVGQGSIVGKPIAAALVSQDATVTACNKYTEDLPAITRQADILIAAAGVPDLICAEHVKPGAVVIDVGVNTVEAPGGKSGETRVVGDVAFEQVAPLASIISPVPGGVGPVTVMILLASAVEAASKQLTARRIQ